MYRVKAIKYSVKLNMSIFIIVHSLKRRREEGTESVQDTIS